MGNRVTYLIEMGAGPFVRYYSKRAGLDFGAAGAGWVTSKHDATPFETTEEATKLLETLLVFQTPDCRITPHASNIIGDAIGSGPYKVLGVAADATVTEITAAYRALAMEHHPDRGGDPERFKEVAAAYESLCRRRRSEC